MYTNLEIKELSDSEIEITAIIPYENLEPFGKEVLAEASKNADIPGFRPGHVPEKVVRERMGEQSLLAEMAEKALGKVYSQIIKEKDIRAIGRPEVTVLKLASGNPFEFKIKTAVLPNAKLPDYKAIAQKEMSGKETVEVTDKEIDDVIADIQKTRTKTEQKEQGQEKIEEELPPLTDEFVKTLGDFKDVSDFKARIKENLLKEKEVRAKEKKRLAISENIIKETKIILPRVLIDAELEKMKAQFQDDVMRMGVKYEDYLAKIKKTEEELLKEWEETAAKRAKLQIILSTIAKEEELFPNEKEVKTQIDHLKEHHKEVDPERIRAYVETLLMNEKVFEFLEKQDKKSK